MFFESLMTLTVAELGKFVLTEVLKLPKAAMEDYVKDFFKDCIKGSVAGANAHMLKQPMAEAIGLFIQRFVAELQFNDVDDPIIDHHYQPALKKFVKDRAVRPILGKAFERECKKIHADQLAEIWEAQYKPTGSFFPADFDWSGVTKEYVKGVKGIIKRDGQLRPILDIELQERIEASNQRIADATERMAGIPVEFDLRRYRESILEQYGALQLESLGSAKYEREGVNYRTVSLWKVFVGQSVRECQEYTPQTYEIPKEQLRRLQEAGDVEAIEEAEQQQQRYFQQPIRPVLEVIGSREDSPIVQPLNQYSVILGDPGSGKSTLLRYLAVKWAEAAAVEQMPLLIELRGYTQSKEEKECKDFLEFVHKGSNWVGHLDQLQLEQWLTDGKVLVMFDGLDEVVDRQQRGTVLKQIHSFTQRYSQVPVVVTSRVIGYQAEALRNAGFQHFMLQELDREQIADFMERWHRLTYQSAADRAHKQQRLEKAIRDSKAIQELAGNPLLLTLMAILNRGEELPRDRARLYEKAAEVLLYQWDVEAKLLKDPKLSKYQIEIDYRDKQAMLQRVAYFMQENEKGLAGNFIQREDLEDCLVEYLKTTKEAQNAPSIAALMINQLRERNFILCHLGGDNYAFVHRTFLEYFCATEIKRRFDKRGTDADERLELNQLRDEVFGKHWQDETWHEVLRLICSMIDESFVGQLIDWLMQIDGNLLRIYLAADCLAEVRDRSSILDIDRKLFEAVKRIDGRKAVRARVVRCMAKSWRGDSDALSWLLDQIHQGEHPSVFHALIYEVADKWNDDQEVISELQRVAESHHKSEARAIAIRGLSDNFHDQPDKLDIFNWLQDRMTQEEFPDIAAGTFVIGLYPKATAISALATYYADRPETFNRLYDGATHDSGGYIRKVYLEALLRGYPRHPKTRELLKQRVTNDPDPSLRDWAHQQLQQLSLSHDSTAAETN